MHSRYQSHSHILSSSIATPHNPPDADYASELPRARKNTQAYSRIGEVRLRSNSHQSVHCRSSGITRVRMLVAGFKTYVAARISMVSISRVIHHTSTYTRIMDSSESNYHTGNLSSLPRHLFSDNSNRLTASFILLPAIARYSLPSCHEVS